MARVRMRRKPKICCQLDWKADFGYGPIEYHLCTWPATFRLRLPATDYTPPENVKACDMHARKLRREGYRVYRFRTLPPVV